LAFCVLLVLPVGRRRWMSLFCQSIVLGAFLLASCGGGGGGGGGSNPPPVNGTPAGTYTVLVTGTANGIVHNTVVSVVVH